jgi:predicted alpha/beta-hydrolase family hydrolase
MNRFLLVTALWACLPPTIHADIDAEIVGLSLRAIILSESLRQKDLRGLSDATLFEDGSDAALLVKEDGYCFAIYDTTEALSIADWAKNIDTGSRDICSVSDSEQCCRARRGYVNAYSNPDYRDELNSDIIKCNEDGYKVILAGHSAGGATASVAAVALSEIDLTVISFGQPAVIIGECTLIDQDNYYHWINTDVNGSGSNLDYDPVPFITLTNGAKQMMGKSILIGDDPENVVQYTNGEIPGMFSWGIDVFAHRSRRYVERLKAYEKNGGLKTNGWSAGYDCNLDAECISGDCGEDSPKYWSSGKCQV